MKDISKVTEDELAVARHTLAMEILNAPNAGDILHAMNRLTMTQAKRAKHKHKKGKKAEAKQWKRSADELYTVMMCAVYTKQDQNRN